MKKTLLIILLVVLTVLASLMLLSKRRHEVAETPVAKPMIHSVRTTLPKNRTLAQSSSFLAELTAEKSAAISSKFSGRISQFQVYENQQVQAADLLVKIDDQEIVTGIKSSQAQLVAAQKKHEYDQVQYDRNLSLYKIGGLSLEKLEASAVTRSTAKAAVKDLEQRINGLKSQLEYLNIKAPYAGIIGTIFLRQGDLASPGRPILTLNSLPQKLTLSFVPESTVLHPGQVVLRNGEKIGQISRLYNDAKNGLSIAEISPDKQLNLPSKSYLTIDVITKTATGCSLPIQALLHRAQGISIMIYQDNLFTEVPVKLNVKDDKFAIISPCVTQPVALAAEAKLSLLPAYGQVRVFSGLEDE